MYKDWGEVIPPIATFTMNKDPNAARYRYHSGYFLPAGTTGCCQATDWAGFVTVAANPAINAHQVPNQQTSLYISHGTMRHVWKVETVHGCKSIHQQVEPELESYPKLEFLSWLRSWTTSEPPFPFHSFLPPIASRLPQEPPTVWKYEFRKPDYLQDFEPPMYNGL